MEIRHLRREALIAITRPALKERERKILNIALDGIRKYSNLPMGQGKWASFTAQRSKLKKTPLSVFQNIAVLIAEEGPTAEIKAAAQEIKAKLEELSPLQNEIEKIVDHARREVVIDLCRELLPDENIYYDLKTSDPDSAEYHGLFTSCNRALKKYYVSTDAMHNARNPKVAEIMPERMAEPEAKMVKIIEEAVKLVQSLVEQIENEYPELRN